MAFRDEHGRGRGTCNHLNGLKGSPLAPPSLSRSPTLKSVNSGVRCRAAAKSRSPLPSGNDVAGKLQRRKASLARKRAVTRGDQRVYATGMRPGLFAPKLDAEQDDTSSTFSSESEESPDVLDDNTEEQQQTQRRERQHEHGEEQENVAAVKNMSQSGKRKQRLPALVAGSAGEQQNASPPPAASPWNLPSLPQARVNAARAYADASGAARTSVPAISLACERLGMPCARDKVERHAVERAVARGASALRWFANPDEAAEFLGSARANEACGRLPGMHNACAKAPFARLVTAARVLAAANGSSNVLEAVPHTWVLPADWRALKQAIAERKIRTRRLIAKPSRGSQGDGIAVVEATEDAICNAVSAACRRGMEASLAAWARTMPGGDEPSNAILLGLPVDLRVLRGAQTMPAAGDDEYVVQEFVDPPLTVDNRKFDLRLYAALVTGGGQPSRAYLCRDGLARLCVDPVELEGGSPSKLQASALLTNTALNKKAAGYTIDHTDVTGGSGTKRSARAALATAAAQVEGKWGNGMSASAIADTLWARAASCVGEASELLLAVAEAEWPAAVRRADSHKPVCVSVLGWDVMFTTDGRCVLLEANASPSWVLDIAEDIPDSVLGVAASPARDDLPITGKRGSGGSKRLPRLADVAKARAERIRRRTQIVEASARLGDEVCHCRDSDRPHVHVPSPVDEHVKTLALCGALELAFARIQTAVMSDSTHASGWTQKAYDLVYEDNWDDDVAPMNLLRHLGRAAHTLLDARGSVPTLSRARKLARSWVEALVKDSSRARSHADVAVARWKTATKTPTSGSSDRPLLLMSALTLLREVLLQCQCTSAGLATSLRKVLL
ncbi:tubulin polyglutamylase TTLL11 [Pycnococcus provasolii]